MKKKIVKIIFLIILFSIASLSNINTFCKLYPLLGSDNQTLLLWQYASSIDMHPYKDIFYPYGLLNYYRDTSVFFGFVYFLLVPILLSVVFLTLKYLFKDKLFTATSLLVFYLFIVTVTGFETLSRYGVLVAIAILFSYMFFNNKNKIKKIIVTCGVLIGLLFPLMNDLGLYAVMLFVLFTAIHIWIRSRFRIGITGVIQFFKEIYLFFLGGFIGLVPFFVYLFFTDSFPSFVFYLQNLREISFFAKTPFFHSIASIDNVFTLGMLIISISFLCLTFFLRKTKITFNTYLQIGLVISLILLEQKSIIRQIDTQISFVGLLLFFCLFYELLQYYSAHKIKKQILFLYFLNTSVVILFLIGLHSVDSMTNPLISIKDANAAIDTFRNKSCVDQNINHLTSQNAQFMDVKNRVDNIEGFNGKIFTFPGDPVLYILFEQTPPYYPTIYEATPLHSQQMLIDYIENQKINVILYNTKIISIQDEVPDKVRGRLLFHYMSTHFSFYDKVWDYTILKRNKEEL